MPNAKAIVKRDKCHKGTTKYVSKLVAVLGAHLSLSIMLYLTVPSYNYLPTIPTLGKVGTFAYHKLPATITCRAHIGLL